MTYSMLHLVTSQAIPYDVVKLVDTGYKRNILHWAVINKQRELIELIVSKIDADKRELR